MTVEIKVELESDDAERKLEELDDSLEGARKEADKLDKATKKEERPAVRRRAAAAPGATAAGASAFGAAAGKAFAVVAAGAVALKVAEVVAGALEAKLEAMGLKTAAESVRSLSEKATEITSKLDQLRGGISGAIASADPFAQAGLTRQALEAGKVGARIGATRALQEAHLARRRGQRAALVYGGLVKDTAGRILSGSW